MHRFRMRSQTLPCLKPLITLGTLMIPLSHMHMLHMLSQQILNPKPRITILTLERFGIAMRGNMISQRARPGKRLIAMRARQPLLFKMGIFHMQFQCLIFLIAIHTCVSPLFIRHAIKLAIMGNLQMMRQFFLQIKFFATMVTAPGSRPPMRLDMIAKATRSAKLLAADVALVFV